MDIESLSQKGFAIFSHYIHYIAQTLPTTMSAFVNPKRALINPLVLISWILLVKLSYTDAFVSRSYLPEVRPQSPSSKACLSMTTESKSMQGCVCVVTGASRGIGKGVATELGKQGATVYITGTSTSTQNDNNNLNQETRNGLFSFGKKDTSTNIGSQDMFVSNSVVGGPETIEVAAKEVTKAGGLGIPVYCDHSKDEQVEALFERVKKEQGRLDLLVNNAFRIPPGGADDLFSKFWDGDFGKTWDSIHTVGSRSHFIASCYAVPIMKENNPKTMGQMQQPLIAMISSFGGITYTFNVAYGVGKAAVDRMAKDMAFELETEGIACTSFYPGVVLTERTQRLVETGEWDETVGIPLENSESPAYSGKAIVAVATDRTDTTMSKSGTFQVVAELAQEYDFTDIDGKRPPSIRSLKFLLPAYGMDQEMREKVPEWLIPDWKLPFWIMANGAPPSKED